jgi:hypothetical protein
MDTASNLYFDCIYVCYTNNVLCTQMVCYAVHLRALYYLCDIWCCRVRPGNSFSSMWYHKSTYAKDFKTHLYHFSQVAQSRQIDWVRWLFGVIPVVLIVIGFLPQYWEIFVSKRVHGISHVFLAMDFLGSIFSILSLGKCLFCCCFWS